MQESQRTPAYAKDIHQPVRVQRANVNLPYGFSAVVSFEGGRAVRIAFDGAYRAESALAYADVHAAGA